MFGVWIYIIIIVCSNLYPKWYFVQSFFGFVLLVQVCWKCCFYQIKQYSLIVHFVWLLHNSCSPRRFYKDDSFVCVCNSSYCDSFADYNHTSSGIVLVFQSDKNSNRFAFRQLKFAQNNSKSTIKDDIQVVVTIDRNKPLQSVIGFGGAFTDATGINIGKLDHKLGLNVIKDYFGNDGLRYSMGRVPIGGTDFSTHPYTYNDVDQEDFNLTQFKLANEDFQYKVNVLNINYQTTS